METEASRLREQIQQLEAELDRLRERSRKMYALEQRNVELERENRVLRGRLAARAGGEPWRRQDVFWCFQRRVAFADPIRCNGRLGLWLIESQLAGAVEKALSRALGFQ